MRFWAGKFAFEHFCARTINEGIVRVWACAGGMAAFASAVAEQRWHALVAFLASRVRLWRSLAVASTGQQPER